LQPGQTFDPVLPDTQGKNVKNSLSRQQFGGTVGFPIKKDRTFLFAAFDGCGRTRRMPFPFSRIPKSFASENGLRIIRLQF